ncbi:hypothetical protein [Natrinema sp. 1APR25-10V2]|uniref:phage NrS-1 polymerase family protein n=1 Tax=Natrinema sp. 1APR25-10V2 TaxID=2951081 RepID=UPI0028762B07|nr:hypothetical protein [Natrinema sp. 1APR25-10V2]MDS0476815.1 hypothetical protein [Natrinema sp. 1APR25-10V2]
MVDTDYVPDALQDEDQWVCWRTETRDGTTTKVPVEPGTGCYARVSAPETWRDYRTTREYARQTDEVDGIGFVFTAADPYAGVDLDTCRDADTGAVENWVTDVLQRLDSYTEVSPSGTGFHVIVEGTVPGGGNRSNGLELYDRDRYFTVTGDRVPGTPTEVAERYDALAALHHDYIAETGVETPAPSRTAVPVSDEELLEKARTAANGDKFEQLYYRGDTSGYPSHSEADLALCSLLAFWTGGDPQRIERLFDQSGLAREKWRDRPDYRERTIQTAIEECTTFYESEKR